MFKGTFEDYLGSPERKAAFDVRTSQAEKEGMDLPPSDFRMKNVSHADKDQYEKITN